MASPHYNPRYYEQSAYSYGEPQPDYWNNRQQWTMNYNWQHSNRMQWQQNNMQRSNNDVPYYPERQRGYTLQTPYQHVQTRQELPSSSGYEAQTTSTYFLVPVMPSTRFQYDTPFSQPPPTLGCMPILEEQLGNTPSGLPVAQSNTPLPQPNAATSDWQPTNGYYPGEISLLRAATTPSGGRAEKQIRKRPKPVQNNLSVSKPPDTDCIKKERGEDDEIMIIEPSFKRIKVEIHDSSAPGTEPETVSEFPISNAREDDSFADLLAAAGLSQSDLQQHASPQPVQEQLPNAESLNCPTGTDELATLDAQKTQTDQNTKTSSGGFCGKCTKSYQCFREHMRTHIGNVLIGTERPHLAVSQYMETLANRPHYEMLKERSPLCQLCALNPDVHCRFYGGSLFLTFNTARKHLEKIHSLQDWEFCFPKWTLEQVCKFKLNFAQVHTENVAPVAESAVIGDCRLSVRQNQGNQLTDANEAVIDKLPNTGQMFPAQSDFDLLTRFENYLADQTAGGNEVVSDSRCSSGSDRLVIDTENDPNAFCLQPEANSGAIGTETVAPSLILLDLLRRQVLPPATEKSVLPVALAAAYRNIQQTARDSDVAEGIPQNLHTAPSSAATAKSSAGTDRNLHTAPPSAATAKSSAGTDRNLHTAPSTVAVTEQLPAQNLHTESLSAMVAEKESPQDLHSAPAAEAEPPLDSVTEEEPVTNLQRTPSPDSGEALPEPNISPVAKEPTRQHPLSLSSINHKLPQGCVPHCESLLVEISGEIDADFAQIITENNAWCATNESVFDNWRAMAKAKTPDERKIERKLAKLTTGTNREMIRFPGDFSCRRSKFD